MHRVVLGQDEGLEGWALGADLELVGRSLGSYHHLDNLKLSLLCIMIKRAFALSVPTPAIRGGTSAYFGPPAYQHDASWKMLHCLPKAVTRRS